ncbi:MAG: Smr/MutS family protein [Polyangiales bacterium]
MAKKRKGPGGGKPGGDDASAALPKAPERLGTQFKDALGPLKKQMEAAAKAAQEKPKPPPPPPPSKRKRAELDDDAMALSLAMQGVKPLVADRPARVTATTPKLVSRTARVAPFGRSAEDEARARLDDLVARDVSFRIEADVDYVRGARTDAAARVTRELARRTRASETLDLHGMSQAEAREQVMRFVRRTHKAGLTVICVVHGKGLRSEGGVGVLRDCVVRTLTETGVSQVVLAFVTAPETAGGSGALFVELKH